MGNRSSRPYVVLLGNGEGTFQTSANYRTGSFPQSIVTAEFNGDGKFELATANQSPDTVSVLVGNGNGIFKPPVD